MSGTPSPALLGPADLPTPGAASEAKRKDDDKTRGFPRKPAVVLLRFTLLIGASYLLIAQLGWNRLPTGIALGIVLALASNVALLALPSRLFHSSALTVGIVLFDTLCITGALVYTERLSSEFFYLYFFVLFLAAIGESLWLIGLGALLVAGGYLYILGVRGEPIWTASTLLRLPFLFTVAVFYGYLVDRVRREKKLVRQEAEKISLLEGRQARLRARASDLEQATRGLEREVGEREKTARQLEAMNEELQSLSQLKSDFISNVSHELRTPLTSIRNAVDLLRSGRAGDLSADQRRFVEMAARNVGQLRGIIEDLLDLSKIEAGKLRFRFGELDVSGLLEEIADSFREEAASHSLELTVDTPAEGLPRVWADRQRIHQTLTNLVGNALKFTPAEGHVTLGARAVPEGVELDVTDTGVGLAPEEREKIFDRFYQVDDTVTHTVKGSGLGLAIVRRLLAAHGSQISVESEPGEGSRFSFVLPQVSGGAVEMSELEAELQPHQRQTSFFSLLVVGLEGGDGDRPEAAEELEALAGFIQGHLVRTADYILRQPELGRLVVVLPVTEKAGALRVVEKLQSAMALPGAPVAGAAAVLGTATFPEDGLTGRELIDRASRPEAEEES